MTYRSDNGASTSSRHLAAIDAVFGGAAAPPSAATHQAALVPVSFKRRRAMDASKPSAVSAGSSDEFQPSEAGNRQPRIFTIAYSMPLAESSSAEFDSANESATSGPPSMTSVPARKRRRRDCHQAPGEVTRIVFEQPSNSLAAEAASETMVDALPSVSLDSEFELSGSTSHAREFGEQYEQVLAALDAVRATLRGARDARRFSID